MLPLPLLPLKREETSHSLPAPAQSPSHGWQSFPNFCSMDPSPQLHFFTNCCSMALFLEVQSFRNRLLQCATPMGSQALVGDLSSVDSALPRSTGPARSLSHGLTASFGLWPVPAPSPLGAALLYCGPPWAQLAHHVCHHGLQGNLWSDTWNSCSPPFSTDSGNCRILPVT